MIKIDQERFYTAVGRYLTVARERKKLSISQLARLSGEQFKTVRAIEEGNNFHFHQAVWIASVLGVNINEMIREIETMEGSNGSADINQFI